MENKLTYDWDVNLLWWVTALSSQHWLNVSQLLILVLQKCPLAECQWDQESPACTCLEGVTVGVSGSRKSDSRFTKVTRDLSRRRKINYWQLRTSNRVNSKIICLWNSCVVSQWQNISTPSQKTDKILKLLTYFFSYIFKCNSTYFASLWNSSPVLPWLLLFLNV